MNCEEARRTLRQRFDDGDDLARGLEAHLADCASCRKYAGRLHALNGALMHLPLEEPAVNLRERVRARVGDSPKEFAWLGVAVLAAVLIVVAGAIGWFYPVAVDPASLSAGARNWLAYLDPGEAGTLMVSQASKAWEQSTLRAGQYVGGIQPFFFWLILGAMALVLLAFNGFEAAKVHSTGSRRGSSRGSHRYPRHQTTNENGH